MMNLTSKAKGAKWLSIFLFSALLLTFCVWQLSREDGPSYFFWVVQTLPLLIFIPGLKANSPKAYIGLCFIVLMYFIKGVEGVFHPAKAWIDVSTLVLSVLLFISAMFASRWLQASQQSQSE